MSKRNQPTDIDIRIAWKQGEHNEQNLHYTTITTTKSKNITEVCSFDTHSEAYQYAIDSKLNMIFT